MVLLIAGAAGFIGSHLTDALLAAGHTVVGVDNFSLGRRENIAHLEENPNFQLVEADFSSWEATCAVFERFTFHEVYHLIANSDIRKSSENPAIEYDNTLNTTYHILECMRCRGVKRLFFASSSAIYGEKTDVMLTEETGPLTPVSYYGAAKLASEALISAYSHMNDMQSVLFRFPNVIGPRLTHGVVFDFIKKLRGDPTVLEILGDGTQEKPYMYVSDLVEGILFSMRGLNRKAVNIYNIGVDSATSVREIADMVCSGMGLKNVRYCFTGGNIGWKGDVPRFRYDLSKIHAAGWRPRYTSNEAVARTIKDNVGSGMFLDY